MLSYQTLQNHPHCLLFSHFQRFGLHYLTHNPRCLLYPLLSHLSINFVQWKIQNNNFLWPFVFVLEGICLFSWCLINLSSKAVFVMEHCSLTSLGSLVTVNWSIDAWNKQLQFIPIHVVCCSARLVTMYLSRYCLAQWQMWHCYRKYIEATENVCHIVESWSSNSILFSVLLDVLLTCTRYPITRSGLVGTLKEWPSMIWVVTQAQSM